MTTFELQTTRTELKAWIDNLNDESVLDLLHSIKLSTSELKKDWWNELTEREQEDVNVGLKDLEEGNILSSKEFWRKVDRNNG